MCRGRHRVENRVQARGGGRGGVGWGGVVMYFAGRIVPWYKCCSLAPGNVPCLSVCLSACVNNRFYNCALQLHSLYREVIRILAMAVRPSLISRGRSCRGGKRPRGSRERAPVYVQCEPKNNDEVALRQLPSNFAISLEGRLA